MAKQRQHRSGRRFIRLWTNVKRSTAYHGLSLGARAALLELLDAYNGANNGMIADGRCASSPNACDAREMAPGSTWQNSTTPRSPILSSSVPGEPGVATEWRLTFYRCDRTGDLPVSEWKEATLTKPAPGAKPMTHAERQKRYRDRLKSVTLSVPPERHHGPTPGTPSVTRDVSCPTHGTQTRNFPIKRDAKRPTHGTHIHIHHQVIGPGARTGPGQRRLPEVAQGPAKVPAKAIPTVAAPVPAVPAVKAYPELPDFLNRRLHPQLGQATPAIVASPKVRGAA